ncbi:hypothetical protein TNCV_1962841 [Trichonephila clavipes]|nr:hypothetical protein TNCV_1962841 [Trichonephila clavipes]
MLDHLEDDIRRVIAYIRPQMLEKVIENWTSRLDYIRASRGSHMPKIIFKIFEHHTGKSTFCLGFTPILSEHPERPPTCPPLPPTSRDDLWLYGYLEYPHAAKTLHIYKHPFPSPGFEPRPYGTAVSIGNHNTE